LSDLLNPPGKTDSKETALSGAATRRQRFLTLYLGLALGAATFLLYAPSAGFSFINYDDDQYVFNNAHVLSGLKFDNVIWAFRSSYPCNWHPLTWISHMTDCQLFGANPGPPHLVNALLHSANALLLFFLLLRMTSFLWRSLIVAALFAFHPLHVESVAWIAERKDVLSTFFGFLTILAYQSYTRQTNLCRYALVVFLFTLGLMAKPMLVTLPFVLLLLDYWPLDRLHSVARLWRLLGEKLPLFALSAVSCIITFHVQKTGGAVVPLESLPLVPRLGNILLSYYGYLARTFWPGGLAIPYRMNLNSQSVALCLAGLVLVMLTIAVIALGRRHKFLPVGWFWYLGTLVPVIGIVQVGNRAAADRYTYIPSVGIFLLITWGLAGVFQHRHIPRSLITALAVVALSLCAVLTSRQLGFWRNSETLFKHSLAIDPENLDAQNCLAWSYATDPDPKLRNGPEALRLALHCVELTQRRNWAQLDTLAAAYAECGQFQSAAQTEEEALDLPAAAALPVEVVSDFKTRAELYKSGKAVNAR
jgi:protein O-mannosyl-transferase